MIWFWSNRVDYQCLLLSKISTTHNYSMAKHRNDRIVWQTSVLVSTNNIGRYLLYNRIRWVGCSAVWLVTPQLLCGHRCRPLGHCMSYYRHCPHAFLHFTTKLHDVRVTPGFRCCNENPHPLPGFPGTKRTTNIYKPHRRKYNSLHLGASYMLVFQ